MLLTLAVIFLVLWAIGLGLHILGGAIYVALVLAIIFAIAHFARRRPVA